MNTDLLSKLSAWYDESRLPRLPYWITQNELYSFLDKLPEPVFRQQVIGSSSGGKNIRLVTFGTGEIPVIFESQMHGDEPTTTRSLIDLLSLLNKYSITDEVKHLSDKFKLLFIPMLNPDGAERFSRRTADGIDMNRDALALRTPEAKLLKSVCDNYNVRWAFNLHDQEPRYTAGLTKKPAGVAVLAPASDYERTITEIRLDSMRLSATFILYIQKLLSEMTAKYDETYEPRAFGDAMANWGIRSILVEAGYVPHDRTKDNIRRIITIGLLGALKDLANGDLGDVSIYENLILNSRTFCEYIFQNAEIYIDERYVGKQDVGVYLMPYPDYSKKEIRYKLGLAELGDCTTFGASYRIDSSDLEVKFFKNSDNATNTLFRKYWLPAIDFPLNCRIFNKHSNILIVEIKEGIAEEPVEGIFKSATLI